MRFFYVLNNIVYELGEKEFCWKSEIKNLKSVI